MADDGDEAPASGAGIRRYRPLRDAFRPLPRPKTGFMVEATEVFPVVLTFTPGAFAFDFGMGERIRPNSKPIHTIVVVLAHTTSVGDKNCR